MAKLGDWRDLPLFVRVFFDSIRVSLARDEDILRLVEPKRSRKTVSCDRILRGVNVCFFLRRMMGLRNTCLNHAVVLARALRAHGVEARVHLGARKGGRDGIEGHCWVDVPGEEQAGDWHIVHSCP